MRSGERCLQRHRPTMTSTMVENRQLRSISTRLPSAARKRFYHFRYMCDRINQVSGLAFLATSRGGVIDVCRTSFTVCVTSESAKQRRLNAKTVGGTKSVTPQERSETRWAVLRWALRLMENFRRSESVSSRANGSLLCLHVRRRYGPTVCPDVALAESFLSVPPWAQYSSL